MAPLIRGCERKVGDVLLEPSAPGFRAPPTRPHPVEFACLHYGRDADLRVLRERVITPGPRGKRPDFVCLCWLAAQWDRRVPSIHHPANDLLGNFDPVARPETLLYLNFSPFSIADV